MSLRRLRPPDLFGGRTDTDHAALPQCSLDGRSSLADADLTTGHTRSLGTERVINDDVYKRGSAVGALYLE